MALIELNKVSRVYEMGETTIQALMDINLEIEQQTFVSFVGPSGSGKTTLLNLIGCLDSPNDGEIKVNDVRVNDFNHKEAAIFRGTNIGFIFQNFNLLPILTVYENVEYPLIMVQNIPQNDRRKRVLKYLDAVGMTDQKDKYPSQISGGQKQRAAVARALVTDPTLIVADEPTGDLDGRTSEEILDLLGAAHESLEKTIVMVTHDLAAAARAQRVFRLDVGRLVPDAESAAVEAVPYWLEAP